MDTLLTIRNADDADLEILVSALSDSFARDPMFNWVFPQAELYPHFFWLLVRDVYLPRGIVHLDNQGALQPCGFRQRNAMKSLRGWDYSNSVSNW